MGADTSREKIRSGGSPAPPPDFLEYLEHIARELSVASSGYTRAAQLYLNGVLRYFSDFSAP